MVTLKCTRKLLKLLGGVTTEEPPSPTSALGDWYANVIPTAAGELIVFANERTLLSVALPIEVIDTLVSAFAARVYNLLVQINVAEKIALHENAELRQVEFAKTTSRSVLGSLNEISYHYQLTAEHNTASGPLRLSEVELQLSQTLHKPLDYVRPAKVARRLLAKHYGTAE
ncbi:MAG: hypothetical protein JXA14_25585 [Anaerolineae bacterium]|nr:hypothetical protein [Anaerolineae bacterium]